MGALLELVQEGKILHIGLSEVSQEILQKAHAILGDKLIALQTEYSILNRQKAEEMLPICRQFGIAFVAYSPLARGFLSGQVKEEKEFTGDGEFRHIMPQFQGTAFLKNLKLVQAIQQIAAKKKCTPAQLSLAWLLAQGEDIIPIPGTKKLPYLKENNSSIDLLLSSIDFAEIEEAIKKNPVEGTRYPKPMMEMYHLDV